MQQCDIVVIGGGPAGGATAITLARQGYRVALWQRPRPYPALEGLAERTLIGLRHIGCEQALASLHQQTARQAHWGGQVFEGNPEYLADRERFDQALLQDVAAAGVELMEGKQPRLERSGTGWRLHTASGSSITSEFVIDARGRAVPQPTEPLSGPATTALSQRWVWPDCPAQTLISPFADGWAWLARSGQGWGLVQVFVSTARQKLPPKAKLAMFYHAVLDRLPEVQSVLDKARPDGPVQARFAQPQLSPLILDGRYLRVGDAAFAIDPLSGHGVYYALGGALAAAATVHTLLSRPENASAAEQFYRERIEDDFWRMARIGRDFYRLEQRWPDSLFWHERQTWPDDQAAHAIPDDFTARIECRPVNNEGVIEWRDVIVSADYPRGVWQLAGVELAALLRYLQAGGTGVDYPAPPTALQAARTWLAARKLYHS